MSKPGSQETLFITGYAKLPSGITATELFKIVGVGLEVDAVTGTILAADCTLATDVGRQFVARLLVGKSIDTDVVTMIKSIECWYHGSAQKAIVTALRICHEKFRAFRERVMIQQEGDGGHID
ncbi:MAG: DUF3870 domain-containing protein [Bacillota bacterium]